MSVWPRHVSRRAIGLCCAAIAAVTVTVTVGLSAGLLYATGSHAQASASSGATTPIEVSAELLGGFRVRYPAERVFGELEWLGGLQLSSSDPRFGGFSGLLSLERGERILVVSDRGNWFSARLKQGPSGEPLGIDSAVIAPILDERGVSLDGKHRGDAEGLTMSPGGAEIFVSFEQQHRVLSWALPPTVPQTRPRRVATSADILQLDGNKGLEGLAASAPGGPLKGALIAIAERDPAGGDSNPGWVFGNSGARRFQLRQGDDFDVTDAAFLPGGDLLVLERRFNLRQGLGMRIRRVTGADLLGGGTIEGKILMEADLRHQIDNMEGLAVHRDAAGDTIVTLISDDNQSVLQRTVLLRFRLLETPPATPAAGPALPLPKP